MVTGDVRGMSVNAVLVEATPVHSCTICGGPSASVAYQTSCSRLCVHSTRKQLTPAGGDWLINIQQGFHVCCTTSHQ